MSAPRARSGPCASARSRRRAGATAASPSISRAEASARAAVLGPGRDPCGGQSPSASRQSRRRGAGESLMERRRLGPDGPMVSALGYGAMSFTDFYGPTTEEESHAVLRACLDLGIDHLDTSNVYGMGRSETVIGRFLATEGRDRFTIATKAGIRRDPETGARSFDNSPGHLEAALDASLGRLGVDHVALFYVHRREADRPIEEVAETLAGFVRDGRIGGFGFSEIAPSSLRRAAAVHPVAAVQSEYSLATRAPELGLVQACAELGTSLVAFSPVGRGLLTDTPPTPA